MTLDWAATVVGRMHAAGITGLELAAEAGLSNTYLSAVLHSKKGNEKTRERIIRALERLEEEQHERTERRSLVPLAPATAHEEGR